MATTRIAAQTILPATTVTDVHTVAASKLDTVRVHVTNKSGATATYRLFLAIAGAVHDDDQTFIWDETISYPGSGVSRPIVLAATDVLRAYADAAGLRITVNGISQDA